MIGKNAIMLTDFLDGSVNAVPNTVAKVLPLIPGFADSSAQTNGSTDFLFDHGYLLLKLSHAADIIVCLDLAPFFRDLA